MERRVDDLRRGFGGVAKSQGVWRRIDDLGRGFGSVAKSQGVWRRIDDLGRGFGSVAKYRGYVYWWGRWINDLGRGFGGVAKYHGIVSSLGAVLATSEEDLVAWQSPGQRYRAEGIGPRV